MSVWNGERAREFDERGFVVLPDVFSPDEVARACQAFDRLERRARRLGERSEVDGAVFVVRRADERPVIDRVCWAGAAEPFLLEMGADPRLTGPVARILRVRVLEQLINQAHFKLPGDGVEFPWHQDSRHRRYGTDQWTDVDGRGSFVQTALALDDVDPDNGPLRFLPGSHRGGHRADLGPDGALPDDLARIEPVTATMAAGSVALFGPYVVHGSSPNRSTRPRRVLINGYATPGANRRVYPGRGAGRRLDLRRSA